MLLLKSIILSFSVSAPVGPIGLLCIQRTLTKGQMAGFFTGLGASTANMIYASFAAFGFSVVSSFLLEQQFILRIIGGVFLLYLGVKIFLAKPAERAAYLEGNGLIRMYLSTLFLMITNPTTILNFVDMFAGLGFDKTASSPSTAFIFVSGVFLGVIFWWFLLSFSVSILKIRSNLI
ncbi:LysE family translocator [Parageobacillus sp. VR-IP]|uniref:LysE family translocator n=1 Tax=Parageobacillus sp. VR-IP TaxID=2742205 RepID=UPI001C2F4B7A|nr:LysE family transporter [Parageobacillus sp. VR-IP]